MYIKHLVEHHSFSVMKNGILIISLQNSNSSCNYFWKEFCSIHWYLRRWSVKKFAFRQKKTQCEATPMILMGSVHQGCWPATLLCSLLQGLVPEAILDLKQQSSISVLDDWEQLCFPAPKSFQGANLLDTGMSLQCQLILYQKKKTVWETRKKFSKSKSSQSPYKTANLCCQKKTTKQDCTP